MKTINVTFFIKPNGKKINKDITNVYPDDADFINKNKILISMEEMRDGNNVIYFDYGKVDEDGEPEECIEISFGRTCEDTINAGIKQIKKILNDDSNIIEEKETNHLSFDDWYFMNELNIDIELAE